jgi:hypothetical protein
MELDSDGEVTENSGMDIRGRVRSGVVVLEDGQSLPECTIVTVRYAVSTATVPPGSHTNESNSRSCHPVVREALSVDKEPLDRTIDRFSRQRRPVATNDRFIRLIPGNVCDRVGWMRAEPADLAVRTGDVKN